MQGQPRHSTPLRLQENPSPKRKYRSSHNVSDPFAPASILAGWEKFHPPCFAAATPAVYVMVGPPGVPCGTSIGSPSPTGHYAAPGPPAFGRPIDGKQSPAHSIWHRSALHAPAPLQIDQSPLQIAFVADAQIHERESAMPHPPVPGTSVNGNGGWHTEKKARGPVRTDYRWCDG